MKRRRIILAISFVFGCLLIPFAAEAAHRERGYFAIGGEWLLPVLTVLMSIVILEVVGGIKAMLKETAEMPDEERS